MRIQAAVAVMLAAVLGGCMFTDEDSGPASTPTSDPTAAGREATRSIWGVVPSAPRRKADLKPELIQGAAIAVSADTLLADCRATEGRSSVGLVRHNKYRIAKVTHDGARQVCLLTVSEGPLSPAAGYRSFADLRVGEPVTALASRTSAEVVLARGWLVGKGANGDPFLEASSLVPPGTRSAVLVDGFGNLIGVGSAGPVADGVLLASPVGTTAGPFLANHDLGNSTALLASLTPSPRTQPVWQETIAVLNEDDHAGESSRSTFSSGSTSPAEVQTPATSQEDKGAQSVGSAASDSGGSGSAGNGGSAGADGEGSARADGSAASTGAGANSGSGGNEGAEKPQRSDDNVDRGRRGRDSGRDNSGRGSNGGSDDRGRGGDRDRRGGRGRD